MRAVPLLFALFALFALPACPPGTARASSLEQSLRANQQLAREGQENLTRLTARERALHGDLAAVEDELDGLRDGVIRQEAELARLDRRIEQARAGHAALARDQDAARRRLARLTAALWPLAVDDAHARSAAVRGWEEADRRFAWGAALHEGARRAIADIASRARRIEASIAEQNELRRRAEAKLAEVNAGKDALLERRLDFVSRIREVRAERLNHEQALEQMLAAIEDLEYRLKASTAGNFADMKGALPWPVDGTPLPREAVRDAGGRGGRHDGAGFSCAEGAPVRAVFPGRVVHDAVLRGYGRVVILSHGENWYTLYAFLGASTVSQGSELAQGDVLGNAGYYPAAKGSGLYFELRSGQKAINPVHWLAARP